MKTIHHTESGATLWLALAAAALALVQGAWADSAPAYGLDPGSAPYGSGDEVYYGGLIGWTFYLTQPVTVNGIGWYDAGLDGLSHAHEIGIWKDQSGRTQWPFVDPSNSVLTLSATVPAGTAAPLDGSWRKLDFNASITLEPGGYEIAGTDYLNSRDAVRFVLENPGFGTSLLPDPRLEVGAPAVYGRYVSEPGFNPPGGYVAVYGAELGPMFFIESVPEPSTITLWLGGLCLCLLARQARNR
jgi:PEP-CTERM motif